MSFCTLSDVKETLKIPASDTSQDVLLQDIVDAANGEMLGLFGLTSTAPTLYVNTYDVTDAYSRGIYLVQYPVLDVVSVTEDGAVIDPSLYYLKRPESFGLIAGTRGEWMQGKQKIQIEHIAGFDPVPPSLKRGCIVLAISMYNLETKTGFRSEKIGQYSYSLGSPAGGFDGATVGDLPSQTKRALNQFLRPFAEGY